MGSGTGPTQETWIQTPCVYSRPLSRAAGCEVFLKLENLQPSGSFKCRGIGNLMLKAQASLTPTVDSHFLCSSGGNAGLACATVAAAMGRPATVVVPETASGWMVERLRDAGASVVRFGADWRAADAYLRETLLPEVVGRGVYVPPFDHPDIWEGAATLVDELAVQLPGMDGVVCSVGGGGLLNGIMQSLTRWPGGESGRRRPRVLAVETVGADSLCSSVHAGEHITLDRVTSVATSLGATRVSDRTWQWAQQCCEHLGGDLSLIPTTVKDAEAVMGCLRFLDDARILIETACGATVSLAYNGDLRKHLGRGMSDEEWARMRVVFVVCGGSNITLALLEQYRQDFGV